MVPMSMASAWSRVGKLANCVETFGTQAFTADGKRLDLELVVALAKSFMIPRGSTRVLDRQREQSRDR